MTRRFREVAGSERIREVDTQNFRADGTANGTDVERGVSGERICGEHYGCARVAELAVAWVDGNRHLDHRHERDGSAGACNTDEIAAPQRKIRQGREAV